MQGERATFSRVKLELFGTQQRSILLAVQRGKNWEGYGPNQAPNSLSRFLFGWLVDFVFGFLNLFFNPSTFRMPFLFPRYTRCWKQR